MTLNKPHPKLNFPVTLFLVSILARLLLAPLFLAPPKLPHDFYAYIGGAKCILSGGALYSGGTFAPCWSLYGPALSYLFAAMLMAFGENFLLLKLPAILLESIGTVLFFYIAREILKDRPARYLSVLYAFSYFTLISSGIRGNDDSIFMFFILLSVYFLVKERLTFSALSLGMAASFKVIGIVMLPAFLLYVYRKHTPWKTIGYVAGMAVVMLLMFSPMLLRPESDISWYFFGNAVPNKTEQTPSHMGIFNLIRLTHRVATYLEYGGISDQSSFVMLLNGIVPIVSATALLTAMGYMLYFGIKNPELELMRNMFLLPFTVTLSGSVATTDYVIWFLPFILLMSGYLLSSNVRIYAKGPEMRGIALILVGLLIYAAFYKETLEISNTLRFLLWFVVIFSVLGTYWSLALFPARIRAALTGLVVVFSLFDISVSSPMLILKGVLEQILPQSVINQQVVVLFMGKYYYSSPLDDALYLSFFVPILLIFLVAMVILLVFFHKAFRNQRCVHPPLSIIKRFFSGLYNPIQIKKTKSTGFLKSRTLLTAARRLPKKAGGSPSMKKE